MAISELLKLVKIGYDMFKTIDGARHMYEEKVSPGGQMFFGIHDESISKRPGNPVGIVATAVLGKGERRIMFGTASLVFNNASKQPLGRWGSKEIMYTCSPDNELNATLMFENNMMADDVGFSGMILKWKEAVDPISSRWPHSTGEGRFFTDPDQPARGTVYGEWHGLRGFDSDFKMIGGGKPHQGDYAMQMIAKARQLHLSQ